MVDNAASPFRRTQDFDAYEGGSSSSSGSSSESSSSTSTLRGSPNTPHVQDECAVSTIASMMSKLFVSPRRVRPPTHNLMEVVLEKHKMTFMDLVLERSSGKHCPSKRAAVFTRSDLTTGPIIGAGAFGRIRCVRSPKSAGTFFAVKTITKTRVVTKEHWIDHTNAEARLLMKLSGQCPFIVRTHAVLQDSTNLYMVMDLVPGGELFVLMTITPFFSNHQSQFYVSELVIALDFLHTSGIMFRDLKPENILIGADGHIVLTDFGLATEDKWSRSWCGTDAYMAPEILNAQAGPESPTYGPAVDYWALGCMCFEFMTGTAAFHEKKDLQDMYNDILDGCESLEWPDKPKITPEAEEFIYDLLETDPAKRLGSSSRGATEVMRHSWLKNVDWDATAKKMVTPPWVPKLDGPVDLRYFTTAESEDEEKGDEDLYGEDFPAFTFLSSHDQVDDHDADY